MFFIPFVILFSIKFLAPSFALFTAGTFHKNAKYKEVCPRFFHDPSPGTVNSVEFTWPWSSEVKITYKNVQVRYVFDMRLFVYEKIHLRF